MLSMIFSLLVYFTPEDPVYARVPCYLPDKVIARTDKITNRRYTIIGGGWRFPRLRGGEYIIVDGDNQNWCVTA